MIGQHIKEPEMALLCFYCGSQKISKICHFLYTPLPKSIELFGRNGLKYTIINYRQKTGSIFERHNQITGVNCENGLIEGKIRIVVFGK